MFKLTIFPSENFPIENFPKWEFSNWKCSRSQLRFFQIEIYLLSSWVFWLSQLRIFPIIEKFPIENFPNWKCSNSEFSKLRIFQIENFPNWKCSNSEFSKLRIFHISNCSELRIFPWECRVIFSWRKPAATHRVALPNLTKSPDVGGIFFRTLPGQRFPPPPPPPAAMGSLTWTPLWHTEPQCSLTIIQRTRHSALRHETKESGEKVLLL